MCAAPKPRGQRRDMACREIFAEDNAPLEHRIATICFTCILSI
jgi:hypothetical protein